ncbi:carboxypeptidase-like regulatory domain-containing protein [Flagellimonas sp. HMM57]|uniref:carboxypeptidase-like regulatory domain-containing protein n=1 Tax=unclassified Flagellimonas TaxID=2644544 RepID=UPI0013D32F25|nr:MULTISPECIES: carboxypeptidase-like regulatory domain-containing protein [unclassified Flagellimonas]UII76709.1 carboxypeptidase-like regulatory domain-containing protein [Flagellimonas sp. HMM57]
MKGKIVAKGNDITGVTVQNITFQRAIVTDTEGNFSIAVRLNDTLVFSAVQFKRKIVPVTNELLRTDFVLVPLEEFVNKLKEVIVQPYHLSGRLDTDIDGLQLQKDVSAEAIGLPNAEVKIISQSENKLHDADHGPYARLMSKDLLPTLSINLNKILNRINGKTKMLKKRIALDKAYTSVQQIEDIFIDSLLVGHLKIPEKRFYDFIYFCEMDERFDDLTHQNDELKFWQFLMDRSKAYRHNNGLD